MAYLLAAIIGGVVVAAFVLLVRRRQSASFQREDLKSDASSGLPSEVEAEGVPGAVDALVLGPPDRPYITIRRAGPSDTAATHAPSPQAPPAAQAALAPILQHAPRAFGAAANLGTNAQRLVLSFSPETARGLANGTLELTNLAAGNGFYGMARNASTKRLVEHGAIVAKVNPVAVVSAVWQLAAIVTAQRYLDEINTKLAAVQRGIENVQAWLDDEAVGRLRGHFRYLCDRAEALAAARASPAELQAVLAQVEAIDTDARAVTEQMLAQLRRVPAEIESQKWKALSGTKEAVREATGAIQRARQRADALLLAGQVRALLVTLGGALDLGGPYAQRALRSLEDDLHTHDERWRAIKEVVEDKIPQLRAAFQRGKIDVAHRAEVDRILGATQNELITESSALREFSRRIDEELRAHASDEDMHLLVETDETGGVTGVRQLPGRKQGASA